MTQRYIIFKDSRVYHSGPGYDGPSCDSANVPRGKIYDNYKEAKIDAAKLQSVNSGVGWEILPYDEEIE